MTGKSVTIEQRGFSSLSHSEKLRAIALGEMRTPHFRLAQTVRARRPRIPEGKNRAVVLSFDIETLETGARSQNVHETFLPNLMDVLDEYDLRAHFFVCGKSMELYPESLSAITRKRHGLGGHGWMHEAMPLHSYASQCAIVERVRSASEEYLGTTIRSWRSPYLRSSIWTYAALREQGFNISSSTRKARKPVGIGGILELPLVAMDGDVLGYREPSHHRPWTEFMKRSLSEVTKGIVVFGMHPLLQMRYDPSIEGLSEVLSSLEESTSDTWIGTIDSLFRDTF